MATFAYARHAGTPQTDGVEILERFSLDDDGARLNYTMTVSDPASFVEPVTLAWQWIDIGEQFSPHDLCEVEQAVRGDRYRWISNQ